MNVIISLFNTLKWFGSTYISFSYILYSSWIHQYEGNALSFSSQIVYLD